MEKYFLSKEEHLAQTTSKFNQLVSRITKGFYKEPLSESDLLEYRVKVFDSYNELYKKELIIKLELSTGIMRLSFMVHINNQKALWAVRASREPSFIVIPIENYSEEYDEYLRFLIENYFLKGFDAIRDLLISEEKISLPA